MSGPMQDTSVVVIGGSSGIGLATAVLASAAGAQVTIAGRDEDRLAAALASLPGDARGTTSTWPTRWPYATCSTPSTMSTTSRHSQARMSTACWRTSTPRTLRGPVDNRFWGPLYICKYAGTEDDHWIDHLVHRCRGRAPRAEARSSRPPPGARRSSLEHGGRARPVRVNVVRPGIVDTPLLDRLAPSRSGRGDRGHGQAVPLGRLLSPRRSLTPSCS